MCSCKIYFILFAIFVCNASLGFSYKPVIIIHGILDGASDLTALKKYIQTVHPGTKVDTIDMFDYFESFAPLWEQVESIRNVTNTLMKQSTEGVNVIGYSQGGIVARGLIQTTDDHNIHTFIALSSPLNGQYGDTSWLNWLFPNILKEKLYSIFYTDWGQKWSIANYWKDPHKTNRYAVYSEYLAPLNNESYHGGRYKFQPSWKTNFERLQQVVLIGGPQDEVITPWQSALFGFYNEDELIVDMRQQRIYQDDVIGLRKLDKKGALHTCQIGGVTHLYWHKNETVFFNCIEPHLN